MIDLSLEKELKKAFERLDHERVMELAGHVDARQPLNDYQRVVSRQNQRPPKVLILLNLGFRMAHQN